jgi:hypothetical protein
MAIKPISSNFSAEQIRLDQDQKGRVHWKKWGPYLSERQWGTVREDYSTNGDAMSEADLLSPYPHS